MAIELTAEQKQIIEATREKHGDVYVGATRGGDVFVLRPASTAEASRFQSHAGKTDRNGIAVGMRPAQETLAKAVTVYPVGEERVALFTKYPFLIVKIADRCIELSGGEIEDLGNA